MTLTGTESTDGESDTTTWSDSEATAEEEPIDDPDEECMSVCLAEDFTVTGPPVDLEDVEQYAPTESTSTMEPDGWTVTGLPTNFYASNAQHVVEATLLDEPADVRFTPVAWTWSYGDGDTTVTTTAGASWAALGQDEFTATATSHVYDQPGAYSVALSVEYQAEYRFAGSDWVLIAATLEIAEEPFDLVVGDATTVLVSESCLLRSSGPGC